ncbi:hypothetical protein [Nocardia sp. NPDC003345]
MDRETSRRGADLLATDIETALGHEVHIDETVPAHRLRRADSPQWFIEFSIPELNVLLGTTPRGLDPSGVACELAQKIQDDVVCRSGKVWPADPAGGDQPMLPTSDGWKGRDTVVLFGQVTRANDPDPTLDGVVRWWLPYEYDGLIASHSGDLYFSIKEFRGDEQTIVAGMPVTWTVGLGSHGKYRKAGEVRPM